VGGEAVLEQKILLKGREREVEISENLITTKLNVSIQWKRFD
jgi:hypothetical protein